MKKVFHMAIKSDELVNPNGCLNKALDSERIFVMLARDAAAPFAIRAWVGERIRLGKDRTDEDIATLAEALVSAKQMESERYSVRAQLGKSDAPRCNNNECKLDRFHAGPCDL